MDDFYPNLKHVFNKCFDRADGRLAKTLYHWKQKKNLMNICVTPEKYNVKERSHNLNGHFIKIRDQLKIIDGKKLKNLLVIIALPNK